MSGKCELKRIAKPGDKVPTRGAVSGSKSSKSCPNVTVKAVPCKYTDTKQDILCMFPFVGENPGQKSGGSSHETCLKTKKGHYWCATRLNLDNRVLSTSIQNRDVDCGQRENSNKELYCSPTGSSKAATKVATVTSTTAATKQPQATKPPATSRSSCSARCGQPAGLGVCQCNQQCGAFGDCCPDYSTVCQVPVPSSCSGKCGVKFDRSASCQCNQGCEKFKNCCPDYTNTCTNTPVLTQPDTKPVVTSDTNAGLTINGVSDLDLRSFSENLLASDEDNVARLVQLDPGCTTRVGRPNDCSRNPLFAKFDTSILRKPIYQKLTALYENYDSDVAVKEDRTRNERIEEDDFLDEVMKSKVMTKTLSFLKSKKLYNKSPNEFRKLLKQLWFDVYSRGKRILGSSGFEHVFLGEKKSGKVQGFHNWVYFHHLEQQKKLNYLGHWEKVEFEGKGTGLSFTFTWGAEQKPFASMLVGTSPEFELALYTVCLLARGDEPCRITLGGQPVSVTTHVFNRPGGVRFIASSFMDWEH